MKKLFCLLLAVCCASLASPARAAPNLTAEINIDMRADTAAAAKNDAMGSAIRSGVIAVLGRYSDRAIVENLIMGADESVIQNLAISTSISNERTSKTAYSANFSVTLDRVAVEKWYGDNNVPNFMSAADESKDKSVISIDFANGLSDWAELNQILRDSGENYEMSIRTMFGTSATAYILTNKRRRFQSLAAANGWSVSSRDGILRISK
jgi:hypothetical protein